MFARAVHDTYRKHQRTANDTGEPCEPGYQGRRMFIPVKHEHDKKYADTNQEKRHSFINGFW